MSKSLAIAPPVKTLNVPPASVVNIYPAQPSSTTQAPPIIQYGGPYFAGGAAVIAAAIAGIIAWRGIIAARDNVLQQINSQRDSLIQQLNAQREIAAKASRANVISANRQKWIDGLREDLAEFIAADFVILDDLKVEEDDLSEAEKVGHRARFADAMRTRRLMQRRIELRLNPDKDSHKELYRAVRDLIPASGKSHVNARVSLVKIAQKFLRQEWLRVKSEAGEWDKINTSGPTPAEP